MPEREFALENNLEAVSGVAKTRRIDYDDHRAPAANAPERKLTHNYYTVGWICAITTEYVAAQAFLDEKHDGPQYDRMRRLKELIVVLKN